MLMALLLMLVNIPVPVYAAETSTNVWIRAKISYESDGGLTGLSDEMVTLASDKWSKKDGYYYYTSPLQSGQSVDLMKSVQIPASWNNNDSGKTFNVVVTVMRITGSSCRERLSARSSGSRWKERSRNFCRLRRSCADRSKPETTDMQFRC